MTNQRIINFFLGLEKFLYRHSTRISVISKGFLQTLVTKGVPASKIEVIPVWADPDEVRPMPKDNSFRQKYDLVDKFVVLYAGNIGFTSCLEDVLHAAQILSDQKEIQFVIVGEGVKKESLETEMQDLQLQNILFLPFQPRETFPEMLAAADLSLVTLNAGSAQSSMPSKIFNVMASARPILAISTPGSEISQIIESAGCGMNVPPAMPEKLAEIILGLKSKETELIQMGQNGRTCLEKNYSRNYCIGAYEKMLSILCDQPYLNKSYEQEAL